ncbi:MAG: ABC transporter ATP-binding protein [Propionibacteriales bacterium]|nr:ABC transporter ATP-binding protein [Propionibacteriales bacterium]
MTARLPRVVVEDLVVSYGAAPVLRGLSFEVGPGSCVRVAGGNGAGKTTLLSVLAGLLPADSGVVRVESDTVQPGDHPPLLASPPQLFPYLSVHEHLLMTERFALERGLRVDDAPTPADLELEHVADSLAERVSLGQRQRLAIGMLRTSGSDVWLLDEPFNGLDQAGVAALREQVAVLVARRGVAVVAAHQASHLDGLVTSTLQLDGGQEAPT